MVRIYNNYENYASGENDMKLEMLIARAKYFEKSQKKMAEKLGTSPSRFSDWKTGRIKPTAFEIFQIAEMARLEPEQTFYDVMAEIDKDNEKYWCARLESNQRPSASEVAGLQLLFTFIYNVISRLKIRKLNIAHNQGERSALCYQYRHDLINP